MLFFLLKTIDCQKLIGTCVLIPSIDDKLATIEDLINRMIRPVVIKENGDFVFKVSLLL